MRVQSVTAHCVRRCERREARSFLDFWRGADFCDSVWSPFSAVSTFCVWQFFSAPAYPMAGQGAAAADGAAADVPGDASAPRPRKRKAADKPTVDLTNLDMLTCCFQWELARFLAQAWTRYDLTDSKKRAAMCHCTFLFNYLAGEVVPSIVHGIHRQTMMWHKVFSRSSRSSSFKALARWALTMLPTPTTEPNGLICGVATLLAAPGMEERIAAVVRSLEVDVAPLAAKINKDLASQNAFKEVNVEKLQSRLCVPMPRKGSGNTLRLTLPAMPANRGNGLEGSAEHYWNLEMTASANKALNLSGYHYPIHWVKDAQLKWWDKTIKPFVLHAELQLEEREVLQALQLPAPMSIDLSKPHALEIALSPFNCEGEDSKGCKITVSSTETVEEVMFYLAHGRAVQVDPC